LVATVPAPSAAGPASEVPGPALRPGVAPPAASPSAAGRFSVPDQAPPRPRPQGGRPAVAGGPRPTTAATETPAAATAFPAPAREPVRGKTTPRLAGGVMVQLLAQGMAAPKAAGETARAQHQRGHQVYQQAAERAPASTGASGGGKADMVVVGERRPLNLLA
jgi:hypothetical protein